MGGQKHVGHGHQKLQGGIVHDFTGAVLEEVVGLLLVYIQTYGAQLLVPQGLYQGNAVYQGAAGGVNEDGAVLHDGEALLVYHVVGLVGQRAVQGDEITLAELFRSFLSHLPELADADLSAITRDTEKCCLSVFQSAEDGKISYRDALIYTARRTNRRIILNALACRNDINQGNVKTEAQARAYVWMLLQPYVALDGFSMAVLSDMERTTLHAVADRTPQMIAKLNKTAGTDNDQWRVLPGVLIKIMLTSI